MNKKDLSIDTYSNIAGYQIRIKHDPTGLVVKGSGKSSWNLKRDLMRELETKVNDLILQEGE